MGDIKKLYKYLCAFILISLYFIKYKLITYQKMYILNTIFDYFQVLSKYVYGINHILPKSVSSICQIYYNVDMKYSLIITTYTKTQINKNIVTCFINEKLMHGAIIIDIHVYIINVIFHSTMKL